MSEELEILEQFHEQYADSAVSYRMPDAQQVATLAERVPGGLIELWQKRGWCSYLDGLLWTVNPVDYDEIRDAWRLGEKVQIIGRSGFGDLLAVSDERLLTVHVHTGNFQKFDLRYEEVLATLFYQDDVEELFFGDLYREAAAALGQPGESEIFTFHKPINSGGPTELDNVRGSPVTPALVALSKVHQRLRSY